MNSYEKVDLRLRIRKLSEKLRSWYKQLDAASRNWSHLTENGLEHHYVDVLYGMMEEIEHSGYQKAKLEEVIVEKPIIHLSKHGVCKMNEHKLRKNLEVEMAHSVHLLEKLEDEITKRRLAEDENHQLHHELKIIRSFSVSDQPSSRSSYADPLPLPHRKHETNSLHLRGLSSSTSSLTTPRSQIETYRSMLSPRSERQFAKLTPRRSYSMRKEPEHHTDKDLELTLTTGLKDTMFDTKPTSIAKDFKSLFDNEWTKVYADMRKFYSEQYVIDLLLSWLKDCYLTSIAVTEEQKECIRQDALRCFGRYINGGTSMYLPTACTNGIKEFQKRIAYEGVPLIKKVCIRRLLSGEENADYPLKYISRCSELCWLMCNQTPPMVLNFGVSQGELINRKQFTSLLPKGEMVDLLVWPAVIRFTGGHLLQRGVVKTAVS